MSKTKKQYKNTNSNHAAWYRQPWVIALSIIIILAIVAAVIVFCVKPKDSTSVNNLPQDTTQTSPKDDDATDQSNTNNPETPDDEPEKVTQYEGEDPNTLEELTGSIARKGIDNGNLVIVAMIDQYLNAPGNCVLILSGESTGTKYTTSTTATADVSTSICGEFIIDASKLPSDLYRIEIQISGDNKTGTIQDEVRL